MTTSLSATGVVKSMRLPDAFSEHNQQIGGFGPKNWSHRYNIPKERYPEICLRYSGYPIYETEAPLFREILAKGAHLIFDESKTGSPDAESSDLIKRISPALGNAGDNQIYNSQSGLEGPTFHLEMIAVELLNNRPVLRMRGLFHTPKKEPKVYLDCLFIDASPGEEECRVEELFLEAFPQELFQKHLGDFETVLASLVWNS